MTSEELERRLMALEDNNQTNQFGAIIVANRLHNEKEELLHENNRLKENNLAMQEEMARTWAKYDKLLKNWNELKGWLRANDIHYAEAIPFKETLRKMQELEKESDVK